MLKTSRGTLTTSRGGEAPSGTGAGAQTYHFTGSDAESLGGGRWRFSLTATPASIDLVDYDGALLYDGLNPGFTWEGGTFVDLELPSESWSDDARVHIRVTL